ncbi:MAG TPA: HEAT repeat domain-containing protein [Aggregatilineales bacterium]|nr:HEAT repeat domain-containing protein [Anaerolineales bacterium]HRE46713.1 HEAT repeat domain-containing protein [Aggregatilineales bacterium]
MTNDTPINDITGYEPRLSEAHSQEGARRLSLRAIATMLNTLPPESIALDVAEAALRSPSFFVRYGAASLLEKRGDRDARLVFERVLSNGETPARASVARHLGGFSYSSIQPLIERALGDPEEAVREGVIYSLCEIGEPHAYERLAAALEKETDNVRFAAAWGLRENGDPLAVPALAAALKASDPDIRVMVLEALGVNGSPQAISVTRAALLDPDPDVQYAAALTLLELSGEYALPELIAMIAEWRGGAREAILRGLFHATNYLGIDLTNNDQTPELINVLRTVLDDPDPTPRKAAVWLLSWIRVAETTIMIDDLYEREDDPAVRAHIVRVAVSLMTPRAEAILEAALNAPQEIVRDTALQIMAARRTGNVSTFDETDTKRHGLLTPRLGDEEIG